MGLRVPQDIALVVFDDIKGSHLFDPPLTLVRNPAEKLGQVAMELLLSRLANHKLPPREVMLQPTLIVRRSCGWTGPYCMRKKRHRHNFLRFFLREECWKLQQPPDLPRR